MSPHPAPDVPAVRGFPLPALRAALQALAPAAPWDRIDRTARTTETPEEALIRAASLVVLDAARAPVAEEDLVTQTHALLDRAFEHVVRAELDALTAVGFLDRVAEDGYRLAPAARTATGLVTLALRHHGPQPRGALAASTGLAQGTVDRTLQYLRRQGRVRRTGVGHRWEDVPVPALKGNAL